MNARSPMFPGHRRVARRRCKDGAGQTRDPPRRADEVAGDLAWLAARSIFPGHFPGRRTLGAAPADAVHEFDQPSGQVP